MTIDSFSVADGVQGVTPSETHQFLTYGHGSFETDIFLALAV